MGVSAGLAYLLLIRCISIRLPNEPRSARVAMRAAPIMIVIAASISLAGPAGAEDSTELDKDDPRIAKALLIYHGCSACHEIPGVPGAYGSVGPSLGGVGSRAFIAGGRLQNTPENMERWLMNPQAIAPDTVMPNMRVRKEEARTMVRYLQGLK